MASKGTSGKAAAAATAGYDPCRFQNPQPNDRDGSGAGAAKAKTNTKTKTTETKASTLPCKLR